MQPAGGKVQFSLLTILFVLTQADFGIEFNGYATLPKAAIPTAVWISSLAPGPRGRNGDWTVAYKRISRATRACFKAMVPSMCKPRGRQSSSREGACNHFQQRLWSNVAITDQEAINIESSVQ